MAHLDRFLPAYQQRSVHCRAIDAPPAGAVAAVRRLDLRDVRGLRPLLAARALPGVVFGRLARAAGGMPGRAGGGMLDIALRFGFELLADEPHALVLGYVGQPWRPAGGRTARFGGPVGFVGFDEPGYVRVAAEFRAVPDGGGCILCTETRVAATDARSARRFGRYWSVIAPFGGLLRRSMLAAAARGVA